MATRYKEIPFQLSFINVYKGYDALSGLYQESKREEIPFAVFYTSGEVADDELISVVENIELRLRFSCDDPEARLYMDGIECMSGEEKLKQDEHDLPYLSPSAQEHVIFANSGAREPLIPGMYRIQVLVGEKWYYAGYEVETKEMTKDQWALMKDELEKEIQGISRQLMRGKFDLLPGMEQIISMEIWSKWLVLEKKFLKFMIGLHNLSEKINYAIEKTYRSYPSERGREVDGMTIRYSVMYPDREDKLLHPIRQLCYDLPENRWIKKIILMVESNLAQVNEHFQAALSGFVPKNQEEALTKEKLLANQLAVVQMKNRLQQIKQAYWYRQVGDQVSKGIPHTLIHDARYREIYHFYRELLGDWPKGEVEQVASYQWKSTDVLYELWGVLTIQKMLVSLGYQPKRGWIYNDEAQEMARKHVPILEEGTIIQFEKGSVGVNLYYNVPIQNNRQSEHLYFLDAKHKKPDCRLDVFFEAHYLGTLILEVKYRPVKSLWKPLDDERKQPKSTTQLKQYYALSESGVYEGRGRPVKEVWAIYPKKDERVEEGKFYEVPHVRLMRLTPGEGNEEFFNLLESVLEGMIKN